MIRDRSIAVREGDLVAGKYRVEGVIGVGGMGVVVAARHEQLEQRVAIKLVRDQVALNPEAVQRFLREARAAAKLKSEHAARVLDVGTLESGAPYMVMEFLEGGDLAQLLERQGPLPVDLAADWMAQACEALAEAHAAGIVHRDLKPQNLFLARTVGGSATVKVLDFGVSKSAEALTSGPAALTRTRSMLGSPLYMAPEQMRSSRDVDARADVWALGVVLFELLTRRLPFEAETLPELCLKVVSEPPLSLSAFRPDVPVALVRVVERCLEKDRDKRFANAAELAVALAPVVPSGARSLVERTRSIAASLSGRERYVAEGAAELGPLGQARQGSQTPARTSTPSAWGSKGAMKAVNKSSMGLWLGAGGLAVVGAVGAVLLSRGAGGGSSSEAEGASARAMAVPSAPVQEATAANSAELVSLPPLPSHVSPPETSASAAAAPPSASSHVQPPVWVAPAQSYGGHAAPLHSPPRSKPSARDDDIPALR
jgi:eukaryotic-like serine/threonine-protein kinase